VRVREAVARISYPDLPLLLGTGAPEAAAEGLRLLDAAPGLRPRLRALVRVGERRWDIVLDGDMTVMLPAENPLGALRGVMALDESLGLLSRDLVAVDLRVRERPVLRIAPGAAEDMVLRRAVGMAVGEDT
jgi:cell division protein FtsQ